MASISLQAQDFTGLSEFEYTDGSQFQEMEQQIAEAADYVLSVPIDPDDEIRLMAMQSIIKWMSGTPDYQFVIDETITRLTRKNEMLFGIYMAAMTGFVLDHKEQAADERVVKLGTYEILLDYCQNPENRISVDRELNKAIEARQAGKLERYLGL